MQTLVASAPRSGSSYTAELLGKLGAKTSKNGVITRDIFDVPRRRLAGCEIRAHVRKWHDNPTDKIEGHEAGIEVSDLAVPWLQHFDACGWRIVHLVRDPYLAIASLVTAGGTNLNNGAPWEFYLPKIYSAGECKVNRAVRFWIDWNAAIECHASERVHVEDDLELSAVADIHHAVNVAISKKTNHWDDYDAAAERERIEAAPLAGELAEMARRYGYE